MDEQHGLELSCDVVRFRIIIAILNLMLFDLTIYIPSVSVTCFTAHHTGCMFFLVWLRCLISRAWQRRHIFTCLAQVTCFPTLGRAGMFSRALHRLHASPRLAKVECFPALCNGSYADTDTN